MVAQKFVCRSAQIPVFHIGAIIIILKQIDIFKLNDYASKSKIPIWVYVGKLNMMIPIVGVYIPNWVKRCLYWYKFVIFAPILYGRQINI
jgi:hypothetical protein